MVRYLKYLDLNFDVQLQLEIDVTDIDFFSGW